MTDSSTPFALDVARKLAAEIGKTAKGSRKMTLRHLLKRFGFARRGASNVQTMTSALAHAGCSIFPPLEQVAGLDDTLALSVAPVVPLAVGTPIAIPLKAPAPVQPARPALTISQILGYAQQATVSVCLDDGHGSGFLIDRANGLVMTARHVVGREREAKVRFHDGKQTQGRVLMSHVTLDYAFIQIEPTALAFRLSGEIEPGIGQRVYAIGSPLSQSLEGSVTSGIISSTSRVQGGVEYLQTDTTINPGNSGGPLILEDGSVVGMNVWGRADAAGYNFAVPASYLSAAHEALKPNLPKLGETNYCVGCGLLNDIDSVFHGTAAFYCGRCGTCIGQWDTDDKEEK